MRRLGDRAWEAVWHAVTRHRASVDRNRHRRMFAGTRHRRQHGMVRRHRPSSLRHGRAMHAASPGPVGVRWGIPRPLHGSGKLRMWNALRY